MVDIGGGGVMALHCLLATGACASDFGGMPVHIENNEPVIRVFVHAAGDCTTASQYDYGYVRQLHDFHRSVITAYDEQNLFHDSIEVISMIHDALPLSEEDEAIVNAVFVEKLASKSKTKITKSSQLKG